MDRIKRIERRAIWLLLSAAVIAQLVYHNGAVTLGLALGGGLELLNFYLLRRLIQKIIDGTSPEKATLIAVALMLKFVLLGVNLYLVLTFLPVNPIGVLVGVTLVIVAIVIEAALPERYRRR